MGCSIRDGRSTTLDLPLGAIVGDCHCIAGRSMDLSRRRETFPPTADAIVASALALFQGTYYQWGGVTPWGAACSGMRAERLRACMVSTCSASMAQATRV